MVRRTFGFLAVAVLGGSALAGVASAAPMSGFAGLLAAEAPLNPVEKTQYLWNGYDYCWYDDGWRGPGWYVCDYGPWITGSWWGGPSGWHNWRWRGPHLRGPFHVAPGFHGVPSSGGSPRFRGGVPDRRAGVAPGGTGGGRFFAPGGPRIGGSGSRIGGSSAGGRIGGTGGRDGGGHRH
jgi:hypothetical protein